MFKFFPMNVLLLSNIVIFVVLIFLPRFHAFSSLLKGKSYTRVKILSTMSSQLVPENDDFTSYLESLKSVTLSGFVSKQNNFAETFAFSKLFEKNKWKAITAIVDDISFAKKRLVTPKTVYSGLIDVMKVEVENSTNEQSLETILKGNDAWIAFNVSLANTDKYAEIAAKSGLKRVVFGVNISGISDNTIMFEKASKILKDSGIKYTFIKYGATTTMNESKYPYRIVRGELPVPTEGTMLASQDLYRVIMEVVDLPKSFNNVYGIGSGGQLDQEILVYMKSQGWPERVQVALLMGDLMERIEKKYIEEIKSKKTEGVKPDVVAVLP